MLVRNRTVIGNPKEGALGLVVAPYFLLVELLAPAVEAFGIVTLVAALATGSIRADLAFALFLAAYGFGLLINLSALLLEQTAYDLYKGWRNKAWLIVWSIAEGLFFRPLTVVWRLRGLWRFLRKKTDWGTIDRRGFVAASPITSRQP